uniref:Melan-A n=1 Tax=Periophthalmus magnuspinnatus TaxID=409849 RepID=A0A3B4A8E1_9GOBI
MPRGDFNIYFASGRGGFVRAEEYVCFIALSGCLSVCRSDFLYFFYDIVSIRAVGIALLVIILAALLLLGCWYFKKRNGYKILGVRFCLFNPNKKNYILLDLKSSINTNVLLTFPQVPNAPPAYEKISSGPLPPPYSP